MLTQIDHFENRGDVSDLTTNFAQKNTETVHLVKWCVGVKTPQDLAQWIEKRQCATPPIPSFHITRTRPRQSDAVLNGGSLYWVFARYIQARQRILDLVTITEEDGTKCKIVLEPRLHLTQSTPQRPFQGWRYLRVADAPLDVLDTLQNPAEVSVMGAKNGCAKGAHLPHAMEAELNHLGLRN